MVALTLTTIALGSTLSPTPAGATTNVAAFASPPTCGSWNTYTVPNNIVSATITLTGGGGGGGGADSGGGSPGAGGGGATVSTTITSLTAGQTVSLTIGCGGGGGVANGNGGVGGTSAYGAGGAGGGNDEGGGAGGGATALCIGNGSCSTLLAVAGGGGGGGSIYRCCIGYNPNGGSGGNAALSNGTSGSNGANASNCGGICDNGSGGGGASVSAAGTFSGYGGGSNGSGSTGGNGGAGPDNIGGGGGGGGRFGGAGGGGGNNTASSAGGGGGGAGSSTALGGPSYSVDGNKSTSCGRTRNVCTNNSTPGRGGSNSTNNNTGYAGNAGTASITWTYSQAPVGAGQTVSPSVNKGVGRTINLANSDPDNDLPLTCTIVTAPAKGTLSGGTGCSRTYTANANTSGNDSFTYRVNDAFGVQSPTYTVTIPIANINPTGAAQGPVNVNKTTPATGITLAASDADGDSVTCQIVTAPTKGSLAGGTSCNQSYTGSPNQIGADSFTYRVNDSVGGQSPTYTVSLNVVNRVPSGANQSLTVDAGLATAVAMANSDVDGDTLTCPTSTPTKGVLSGGTSCARTYTSNAGSPNNGIGGADSFTYNATDPHGAQSPTGTVSINIVNPDLSLTKSHTGRFQPGTGTGTYTLGIANSNTSTANGTTTITDTLPAGMTYRSHNVGSSGFTCSGLTPGVSTTITCTRASQIPKNFSSSLTITVDVAENAGSPVNNTAVITSLYELASTAGNNTAVDATDVNRRPTAANVTAATTEGNAVVVGLVGNDADGDALTYSIVAPPFNGILSGSGASRQYIPDGGFVGVDQFTYRVTDTDGLQSTVATVKIYVGVSDVGGVVTNEVTSAPLSGIDVYLIDNSNPSAADPQVWGPVQTDALGAYDLASLFPSQGGVPYGNYVVRFVDPARNFISEYHLDAGSRQTATNVAVDDANPTIQVDAALTPGARVQGVVRSTADGSPTIDGIQVRLVQIGQSGSRASTTSGGAYEFDLLTAGDYQLWFRDVNSGQWVSEWYDEQTTQANAATITLTVGQQLVINEELDPVVVPPPPTSGTITGTVRSDLIGNAPISGIQVRLYSAADGYVKSSATTTDANGAYTFANVASGTYKLWFRSMSGSQWVSEYHANKATLAAADPLTVTSGTTVVDAGLLPPGGAPPTTPGTISGTVTELDGVTPIAGIQVRLYVNGVASGSTATTTDANGNYTFANRPAGQYQVWFRDVSNSTWISEWHLDQPNQASATPVTATNGSTTTVDAQLSYK